MHARNAIAGVARRCKCFPLKPPNSSLFQIIYGSERSFPAKNGAISAVTELLSGETFSIFSRDGFFRDFSSFSAAKNLDPSENDEDFDNNYTQPTSSIQGQQRKKNKSEVLSRDDAKKVGIGSPGFESRAVKGKGKGKVRKGKNDSGIGKDGASKREEKLAKKEIDWKTHEKVGIRSPGFESCAVKGKGKGNVRKEKNDSANGTDKSSKRKGEFRDEKNDSRIGKDKSSKPEEKLAKKEIDWKALEKEELELNRQMQNTCNIDELLPDYSPTERQQKAANVAKALESLKLSHGNGNDVRESSSQLSTKKVNQKRNKKKDKLEKVKAKIANKLDEEEEVQQSGGVSDYWFPQLSPEEKLQRSSRLAKSLLEASLEGSDDEEEEAEQEYVRREEQKSLTVGIIGPPNAGKSTLTNFMVGKKVAAVSRKTNTTTHEILGAFTKGDTQILFFDTPGIGLNTAGYPYKTDVRQRFESSWSSVELYDVLVVIIDAHRHLEKPDPRVRNLVNKVGQEVHPKQKRILCLNKVDLVKEKKNLLKVANEFGKLPGYDKFYMISGVRGSGVEDLLKYFMEQAVRRPWDEVPWHEDPMTLDEDILKSMALEVVREKLLHYIHQEIPYQIDHRLIDWREMEDGSLRIEQHFIVHKHTHRRIIVGKNGSKIWEIGMAANKELRSLFKRTIHLMIQVRLK